MKKLFSHVECGGGGRGCLLNVIFTLYGVKTKENRSAIKLSLSMDDNQWKLACHQQSRHQCVCNLAYVECNTLNTISISIYFHFVSFI